MIFQNGNTLYVATGAGSVDRENKDAYHIKSNFLVYCVGLSPSAKTGVHSSGHDHDLQLFNTKNGSKADCLVGHYATPAKIMFIYENALISARV